MKSRKHVKLGVALASIAVLGSASLSSVVGNILNPVDNTVYAEDAKQTTKRVIIFHIVDDKHVATQDFTVPYGTPINSSDYINPAYGTFILVTGYNDDDDFAKIWMKYRKNTTSPSSTVPSTTPSSTTQPSSSTKPSTVPSSTTKPSRTTKPSSSTKPSTKASSSTKPSTQPSKPDTKDTSIVMYRLYNPNNGDHHYTTSKAESDHLDRVGWNYEGIGWYSGGKASVYRLYNPNAKGAGSHHYTLSKGESDHLDKIGWNYEDIGWYAAK